MQIRNRIKERRRVKASALIPNPKNPRLHPGEQRAAILGALTEIGQCAALRAIETAEGLMLIDGHMRSQLDAELEWDVDVLDLTPEEADLLLATFDAVGDMAAADEAKLAELVAEIETESSALQAMLDDLVAQPKPKAEEDMPVRVEYSVLVKCESEEEQLAVLGELDACGLESRALCAGYSMPTLEASELAPAPVIQATGKVIKREVKIERTPRVKQLEGIFDVPPAKRQERTWEIDFALDRPWYIGLIVGPSGSGKTTLARELFGQQLIAGWPWPEKKSIVDGFPEAMGIQEITGLLSSVGFSSPPSWLKPFHVLSNGEQFRVTLARTLAEAPELAVVDEYTSVVDRTVAQIGSAALAKTIRASGRRFVAVACHYDIEEWLQPDWKYDTASGKFLWRSLRRRPEIQLRIKRVGAEAWGLFRHHHYLDHDLHRSAKCFLGEVAGRPATFTAVLHRPGKTGFWGEHRTVCLPDYQGVGLGNAMSEFVASLFAATKKKYRSTTSHPAMIRHRHRSPLWRMTRAPGVLDPPHTKPRANGRLTDKCAWDRPTASFEYVGPANQAEAARFGVVEATES